MIKFDDFEQTNVSPRVRYIVTDKANRENQDVFFVNYLGNDIESLKKNIMKRDSLRDNKKCFVESVSVVLINQHPWLTVDLVIAQ